MKSGPLIPPRWGASQARVPSGEALLALGHFMSFGASKALQHGLRKSAEWNLEASGSFCIKGGYQAFSTRREDNSIQPLGGLTL